MNDMIQPTPETKPSNMGTTGLADYVLSYSCGRPRALACGRAQMILRSRGLSHGAILRFKHLVSVLGSERRV